MSKEKFTRKSQFQTTIYSMASQFLGTSLYSLCSFALSVVLLRETGSLWAYAGNAFIAASMIAFFGPVAGLLSDRFGRTNLVIGADALLLVWVVAVALVPGPQNIILLSLVTTFLACVSASCLTVISISMPRLVADSSIKIGKMLSLVQSAEQIARVGAPLLLVLFLPLDLQELAAIISLLVVGHLLLSLYFRRIIRIVERSTSFASNKNEAAGSAKISASSMIRLTVKDPVLRIFAPYLAVSTACVELAAITLTPVVISFSSEAWLGIAFAIANASAVVGSILTARFCNRWTKGFAFKVFLLIEGAGAILIGIESQTTSIFVFISALSVGFLIMPMSLVAAQFIWLGDAPKSQQGLLSGLERFSSWLFVPLAFLIGPMFVPPLEVGPANYDVEALRLLAALAATGLFLSTLIVWFTPTGRTLRAQTSVQPAP
ncbi:MFS transporter [Roseibium sp. M-1]